MQTSTKEEFDHPYLYGDRAVTQRRYKKNTNYSPDTRMIFLDSRGHTVNSQIPTGLMQFTCLLSGSPIRATSRLFMNRIWGVISTPNIMGLSPGSHLTLTVDGIVQPAVQLATDLKNIYEWGVEVAAAITLSGVAATLLVADSIRHKVVIEVPVGHTWNFTPGTIPISNPFAVFPTIPTRVNTIQGVHMFRTRYVTAQIVLSASRLLSSSASNVNVLGSSSCVFKIEDPSVATFINEYYLSMPSFPLDYNDVINTITVNFLDEFGSPLVCNQSDWIITEMHCEE